METTVVQRFLRPLSTTWIREVTGVSRQAVYRWKHGQTEPTDEHWESLYASLLVALPPRERLPR